MGDLMELLVEFLLDFIIEGGVEAISDKKTIRWGRLALSIFLGMIIFVILIGVIIFGFMTLGKSVQVGVMIIIAGVCLFGCAVRYLVFELIIEMIMKLSKKK